jgi:hypothetical protein
LSVDGRAGIVFAGDDRAAFRHAIGQDAGTWARAQGWALWKALLVLTESGATEQERVISEVLADG